MCTPVVSRSYTYGSHLQFAVPTREMLCSFILIYASLVYRVDLANTTSPVLYHVGCVNYANLARICFSGCVIVATRRLEH